MILYFSSTGNCKYTAEKIAEKTADRTVSLTQLYKDGDYHIALGENESLGFVLPTYFGVLPSVVADYLERATIPLGAGSYVYAVDTYRFHYGNGDDVDKKYAYLRQFASRLKSQRILVPRRDSPSNRKCVSLWDFYLSAI